MKKVKKFVSLVLAAVMVMAMTVTAFAEDVATGKITISSPTEGETYTIYKIFDVSYSTDKTAYSYTISTTSEWTGVVQAYANETDSGLSLTKTAVGDQYVVTIDKTKFSAAKFAKELKTKVAQKSGTSKTAQENQDLEFTGLPLGYYLVDTKSGALCNLTTTNNEVTIHDKNDVPFLKEEDKENVELGEIVTYTITGKVPNTTGFSGYIYKISDTMSEGLTFNPNSIEVKVGTRTLTKGTEYTCNTETTGFEIIIPVMDLQSNVGETITVTYTAKVNENAVAKISKNEAKLTYSNNPINSTETNTINQEQKVYNAKINIVKYELSPDQSPEESTKKLGGAKFILRNSENEYYKYNTTKDVIEWVDKADADVFETTMDGKASINGLKDGSYELYEIEAPKGYNPLKDPVNITINGKDSSGTIHVDNLTVSLNIGNSKGALLPSTGGIGTTIFYVLGGILVLGAAVVLVVRRRTEK